MTRERAVEILRDMHSDNLKFGGLLNNELEALSFAIQELEKQKPGVWEACNDPARIIHPGTSPKEENQK